jgi:hypothetical protein
MNWFLLVAILFCFSVPLLAQQGQTSGLQFVAPMLIGGGQDSNFLANEPVPNAQPGEPTLKPVMLSDQFLLLTLPKIAYFNDTRRHAFSATWVPEFEMYLHNSDLNQMNQQAVVAFDYLLTRRMTISLGDAYLSTDDPSRTLQNVFLQLPLDRYRENAVRASFEWQKSRLTAFEVRVDHSYTTYATDDTFQGRSINERATGYTFSAARMVGRNQRLRGIYSLITMTALNQPQVIDGVVDPTEPFQQPVQAATLQYRVGLNRGTTVEASGGVINLDTGLNYTFRGALDKRIATYYTIAASFSRTLEFLSPTRTGFVQGLDSHGFYDVAVVRFNGQPSRKTAFYVDSTFARSAGSSVIDSRIQANRALSGRFRFDYRLNDRSVFFSSLESFHQNRNQFVIAPLRRNRFTVGVEISLATEVQRRTSRLNEDTRYVGISDHPKTIDDSGQEE